MWAPHTKHWTVTSFTSNVNKKPWGPSAAVSKKDNHRKLKRSQSLILCYNCGKKEYIYLNCSHLLKNNAYWVQVIKTLNISSAFKHLKNLKRSQWFEVLKDCHSNYKGWLFQLWSWFQKKTENAKFLLTVIWISILSVKVW